MMFVGTKINLPTPNLHQFFYFIFKYLKYLDKFFYCVQSIIGATEIRGFIAAPLFSFVFKSLDTICMLHFLSYFVMF